MNVKRLKQMRQYVDTMDMPPAQRRAAEAAVRRVEAKWEQKVQERYQNSLAVRREKRLRVTNRPLERAAEIRQALQEMRAGLKTPAEVERLVSDAVNDGRRWRAEYQSIMDNEDALEQMLEMTPDELQEDLFTRHLAIAENSEPSLAVLVQQEMGRALARQDPSGLPRQFDAPSVDDIRGED